MQHRATVGGPIAEAVAAAVAVGGAAVHSRFSDYERRLAWTT
jgi:hypothetical protein